MANHRPVWRIGEVEKVAWGLAVNHGGGCVILKKAARG